MSRAGLTAARAGIVACETCGLLSRPSRPGEAATCPRCGKTAAFRREESIRDAWAYILAAAICYVPANLLPVMTTRTIRYDEPNTVIGGVLYFYNTGSWELALIVLVASVVIPLGKLASLAYLLVSVQRGSTARSPERTRLFRMLKTIGRWSMLDVFVVAFVVALIRFQPLMSVVPGPGVLYFAAVVILTIFAADSFDPRLIWDAGETRGGEMAEDPDLPNIPPAEAIPKRRARLPVVWIVPILAALVGIGIAVRQQLNEGPTVRIYFRSAEGVEADKTTLKFKEVEIGKVKSVTLSKDFSRILVTAKIEKSAEKLVTEDARFWIVKPRVTLSGISGIGTLFSGNYIRLEPGKSDRPARVFSGLEKPPNVPSDVPGKVIQLRADSLGSLGIGSPVYYRRLNVGQVVYYSLAEDGKSVFIQIFLNSPFDRFVTTNTRFWETSGIDVGAGSEGLSIRAESLLSMLVGGIAFETPPSDDAAAVSENALFPLAADRQAALSPKEVEADRFALYFPGSLRGLSVGAPVILLGLPVGEVTDIFLEYNPAAETIRTRVDIATYRYRFFTHLQKSDAVPAKGAKRKADPGVIQHQVSEKGLRAQLRTGNLISGNLYVALDFFPDAPTARIDFSHAPPRFPTVPTESLEFQTVAKRLLAKLDKVPVEEIGEETKQAIVRLERTLRRIEEQTLPGAERSFASIDRTMGRVDSELVPGAKTMLEELRKAAASAERALANADRQLLAADAPGRQELRDALMETRRAAESIRLLADYLERNPSALIRGKSRENP